MNETNIDKTKGAEFINEDEKGIGGVPPIINNKSEGYWIFPSDYQIHFYIKYDHFPIKSFGTLNKSVNELYELVYYILYNEKVNSDDVLVLEIAKTGNSIDLVIGILNQLGISRKAMKVMAIVVILITAIEIYDNHNQKLVENEYTESKTMETKAQTEKIKIETLKTAEEVEKIKLEKILLKNKIEKDSIDRINTTENRKKIGRKQRSIQRSVMQKPITQTIINGNIIYNTLSTENQ